MSKKLAQEYLRKGDNINTKVIFDNGKVFELNIKGEIKTMSDSGFSKKQMEQLQGLIHPIVERLDVLEKDVKELKQDVNVLKQDVNVLKQDVNVLKQDVNVLKQDVNVLKQDVNVLKQDVNVLKSFHKDDIKKLKIQK